MKYIKIILISLLLCISFENEIKKEERMLPLACEMIVDNYKNFGNLDKLDNAISTLFEKGIVDQYTESISKWLLAYKFERYNHEFVRIIWEEKGDYFRTAHYEYVNEEILRETLKNFL